MVNYPITGRERMYTLDLARKEAERAVSLPPYALAHMEQTALKMLRHYAFVYRGGGKPFLVKITPMIQVAVRATLERLRKHPEGDPGPNLHSRLSASAREFEDLCVDMPELSLEETERLAGLEPEE